MFFGLEYPDLFAVLAAGWCGACFGHLASGEDSRVRGFLLKIFARYVEVRLLWFIYVTCQGRLRFLTRNPILRSLVGFFLTRPFAKYMDTGVPVPKDEVIRLIQVLEGTIAVGECRCRLAKKTCGHPMRTDIVFRTGADAWLWAFPHNYQVIDKAEATRIVEECARQDMFPMIFIHCSTARHVNEYVICNCCRCGCKVHLLNRTVGQKYFPLRDGGFRSFLNPDKCNLCGECVDRCPFDAIVLEGGKIRIGDCFGCGLCEQVCEQGAFTLKRVEPGPPWAQEAWQLLEAQEQD